MNVPELIAYFNRMDHERERLAVLPNQFADFLAGIGDDLDIHRVGGVFYVRDLDGRPPFKRSTK